MLNHIKAVLFDLDGVLIDSEPIHAEAKAETLNHYHIPFDENIFDAFKGRPDRDFFSYMYERSDKKVPIEELSAYKKSRYEALFQKVQLIKGCKEFVAFCKQQRYRLALVTSATKSDMDLGINKFGMRDFFDVVLTADDGLKHKPDPEPYRRAAELLQVDVSETIVIEDSPNGVESGSLAGSLVIAITTSFTIDILKEAGARYVVGSFEELKQLMEIKFTYG